MWCAVLVRVVLCCNPTPVNTHYRHVHMFAAAGVLYSLYGRNLDSGEAVPYNDQHWRNVVARLHLTQRQVSSSDGVGGRCVQFSHKPRGAGTGRWEDSWAVEDHLRVQHASEEAEGAG